jgi:hypothetical protein
MNFDFKSTFKYMRSAVAHVPKKCKRTHHAIWIILFNVTSTLIILWLYFTNQFLPAIIGSKTYGSEYIHLLKIAIALKFLSSLYASGILVYPYAQYSMRIFGSLVTDAPKRFSFLTAPLTRIRCLVSTSINDNTNHQ